MESFKPHSKLSKTLHRVIHLTTKKPNPNPVFCLKPDPSSSHCFPKSFQPNPDPTRASMEALIAKLFAAISSVKAAYAELQLAQYPYDNASIQKSDEAVVQELKNLSELKHNFLKKKPDLSPPHVTLLLAEIHEQQSLMKMYEITIKKLQSQMKTKESQSRELKGKLSEIVSEINSLQKTLSSSGQFSILDCIKLSTMSSTNIGDFTIVLNYTIRSVRSFVKLMIREMDGSGWDIEAAANSIQARVVFPKQNHRCFAFESFVCREMFDGFDDIRFHLVEEPIPTKSDLIERFTKLKSENAIQYLKRNTNSSFGKFVKGKYLRLVHPKMEMSFSGNLNQRKMVNSGEVPQTAFFAAFVEVAKRVWLLHCLTHSFGDDVGVFQVGRGCRFSEVYMESVVDESFAGVAEDGGFRAAFTVVPGFRIGKTVVQCQVYLLPVNTASRFRR